MFRALVKKIKKLKKKVHHPHLPHHTLSCRHIIVFEKALNVRDENQKKIAH
jgi:hypothetical protein